MAGIANPLRDLPDMHAILDVAEYMLTEHMDNKALDRFQFKLYRPSLDDPTPPKQFTAERQEQSFAAMEAMFGDG